MKAYEKKRVSEAQMMEGPVIGFLRMHTGVECTIQALSRLSVSG